MGIFMVERKTLRKIIGIFAITAGALGMANSVRNFVGYQIEYIKRHKTPIVEEYNPTQKEKDYLSNYFIPIIPATISLMGGVCNLAKSRREE